MAYKRFLKNRINWLVNSLLVLFLVSGLASCLPSSDNDGDDDPDYSTMSGVVSDPEIYGAKVSLYKNGVIQPFYETDGKNAHQATTDESGQFTLMVLENTDLSDITVCAEGGFDSGTGVELDDVEFSAHLQLFENKLEVTVTPLTSLVSEEMENGATADSAMESVKAYLGLSADSNLMLNPTEDATLLEKSVMVTKLLRAMTDNDDSSPVKNLAAKLRSNKLESGGELNDALLTALFSDEEQRTKLKREYTAIRDAVKNPGGFKESMYLRSMVALIEDYYLTYNTGKTLDDVIADSALNSAFNLIGQKTATALTKRVGKRLQKAALDYVLAGLDATSDAVFRASDLETRLDAIVTTDAAQEIFAYIVQMRDMVGSHTKYLAKVPLGSENLLGNDNGKRLEYYYNSDVANTYYASRVLENVFDDRVNDPIYKEIARIWAEAGYFERAIKMVDRNIYTNTEKITALRHIAAAYGKFNKFEEASAQIAKAENLLKKRIETTGVENVTNEEADQAHSLVLAYFRVDDLERGKALLQYSQDTLIPNLNTQRTIGKVAGAYKKAVESFMGELPTAELIYLLDKGTEIAKQIPVNDGKTYYKYRFYTLSEMMKLYAELDQRDGVLNILGSDSSSNDLTTIYGLLNHPDTTSITGGKIHTCMDDVALALARVGLENTAREIADRTLDETYKNRAYAWIGIYKGYYGTIDEGWNTLETYITENEDFIEYLTYNKSSRDSPRFAALLVDAGKTDKARTVLEKTITFLDNYRDATDDKDPGEYDVIYDYGYQNVGTLYLELNDTSSADSALERAESLLKNEEKMIDSSSSDIEFKDYRYSIGGLLELSKNYRPFDTGKADSLADDANALFNKPFFTGAESDGWTRIHYAVAYNCVQKVKLYYADDYKTIACSVFDNYLSNGYRSQAIAVVDSAYTVAENLDGGSDSLKKAKVSRLLEVNTAYARIKSSVKSSEVLEKALAVAQTIASVTQKLDYTTKVAAAHATAFNYSKAIETANLIPTTGERNEAFGEIAEAYREIDAFPGTYVASIDTDGDGKPDFFNAYASADDITASGLILDDDIDGDGYPDTVDTTPYDASSH